MNEYKILAILLENFQVHLNTINLLPKMNYVRYTFN